MSEYRKRILKGQPKRKDRILAIDLGGTHVKVLLYGQSDQRKADSGPRMTPRQMVRAVQVLARGWRYQCVSLGYPGVVFRGKIVVEPRNLGKGWVGFQFERAFGCPVRVINDAAMQAIGDYKRGRMLFLGLGTGLGAALIFDGVVEPMELSHLPYKKGRTYEEYLGNAGLKKLGRKRWEREVFDVTERLRAAFEVEYVVLGGGNAVKLKRLPPRTRLGDNANAFTGAFRLWLEPGWMQPPPASRGRSRPRK
jgi:polyphosphate glucokinase